MFPISDSIKPAKKPVFTYALIMLNIIVFGLELLSPGTGFIQRYALTPANIALTNPQALLTFVTSIFLHGGFFHIASNMYFLWVFSDAVEEEFGRINFLFVFLVSGIFGNFLQYILAPSSTIPMLGASGAVSGVLGAYYVFFPRAQVKSIVFFFFILTVVNIPTVVYIGYWFLIQLFSGIATLPFNFQTGGIAFWAHVGGYLAGYYLAKNYKKTKAEEGVIEGEIIQ